MSGRRYIELAWQRSIKGGIDSAPGPVRRWLRASFFSGAAWMFALLMNRMADSTGDATDAAMEMLDDIFAELQSEGKLRE